MDLSELVKYGDFGFRRDYIHNPDDIMSIYNARRRVIINIDYLPLYHQIKTKRIHDSLTQKQLGQVVGLPASTISLIETGQRLIPKKCYKAFEQYLYEDWYVDGLLLDRYSGDAPDPLEEEMDIEAQRSYWREIFSKDPELWGLIQ